LATFLLFTYLKQFSGKNAQQYPKTVNCKEIKNYFTETSGTINKSNYRSFAKNDKGATLASHGSGYYQCFCQEYGNPVSASKEDLDLCKTYTKDQVEG